MAGISTIYSAASQSDPIVIQDDEAPLLIDTTVPDLNTALDIADIVIHVLDARDPPAYRSEFVEKLVEGKHQIFLLNKIGERTVCYMSIPSYYCDIDMVPKEGLLAWARTLREEQPTYFFRSSTAFLPTESLQSKPSKAKVHVDDAIGSEVLLDHLQSLAKSSDKASEGHAITIAVVGVTNVAISLLWCCERD